METTVDHSDIKRWVEHHEGVPARTEGASEHPGGLQIAFPPDSEAGRTGLTLEDRDIEEISWTRFFETFEAENLAFRYRETDERDAAAVEYEFVDRVRADVDDESAMDELVSDEVMSSEATQAANVETGMDVTTPTGEKIGVVSHAGGGRIYVDPDPGLTDKIKIKLGWGESSSDEDVYPVPETRIERVEGDEVRIHQPE